MRVRYKKKVIAQALVVGLVLLMTIPWLFSKLDSSEAKAAEQRWKRADEHVHEFHEQGADGKFVVKHKPLEPRRDDEFEHPPQFRGQDPNVMKHRKSTTTTKQAKGPKPVYTDGRLGNFEKEYEAIPGPGERGKPVYLSMEEKQAGDRSVSEYGMNMVVSKKVSMDRNVPDIRVKECKYWDYATDMPTASVAIVFHNEGFTTLLRTVHSVINRSPPQFLHEVVLIDDYSDYDDLKGELEEYIKRWGGKVKLYRNAQREGLIRARTIGAKKSTGDVVIFLDAHCEVNYNWLPPLLAVIKEDRKVMAVPIVDGVDAHTFEYRPVYQADHFQGIFEWGFLYKESKVPQKELNSRQHTSEPYGSPTHAGGLFAIDRRWFEELGYYDSGLEIWGGEQYELSFKIWQCGGGMKWVPCSRVGHIYRMAVPRNRGGNLHPKIPLLLMNHIRVIETWFDDEWKEYFYRREPLARDVKVSDISTQLALKERLHCKNFTWFMENVAYELTKHHPIPPANKYWGELKQLGGNQCWDANVGAMRSPIGTYGCHHGGGNQLFRLNVEGQLGTGERCVEPSSSGQVIIDFCQTQARGNWAFDPSTHLLKRENKCVEMGTSLVMKSCDANNPKQKWVFEEIHPYRGV